MNTDFSDQVLYDYMQELGKAGLTFDEASKAIAQLNDAFNTMRGRENQLTKHKSEEELIDLTEELTQI